MDAKKYDSLIRSIDHIISPSVKDDENVYSRLYDRIIIVSVILGIIPLMFYGSNSFTILLDIIATSIFIIDYVLRMMAYGYKRGNKLTNYLCYPFTFMAVVDLLSILPTFGLLGRGFRVARITRLMRLFRIFKLIRYFEPFVIIASVVRKQRTVLGIVLGLACFYIFITALIMFNSDGNIVTENGTYLFNNFFDALYWSACTLTTVGYGDIYPVSGVGKLISMVSAIIGVAVIALPSGVVTAGYLEELKLKNEK